MVNTRLVVRVCLALALGLGVSVGVVAERADACCSYVNWWNFGGGYFKDFVAFEHTIKPVESNGNGRNYWATQWGFSGSDALGYTGVQTHGTREDEGPNPGPVALFSLWGAISAVAGPNARCRPFDWEGVGILCRIDLPTVLTSNVMRVSRSVDGRSWTGSIQQKDGVEEVIGTITMPYIATASYLMSWVEYFGANNEKQCEALIGAAAYLTFPIVRFENGSVSNRFQAHPTKRPCIQSTMVETIAGEEVFLAQGQWTVETPTTTTTTTTIPPTTTTVAPRDQLLKRTVGAKCLKLGAKRKVGNKTLICKRVLKSLKWVA